MSIDSVLLMAFFLGTTLLVMLSIEGNRLGRIRQSQDEKEVPLAASAAALVGLLAFILAFTFGIAANRFDARKDLVRGRSEQNQERVAGTLAAPKQALD